MQQLYYELRHLATSSLALAADIAKHLQARQYLGTTLVVCDNPHSVLSATRKQWLKGARYLQKLRASTLNAEEILRLTHAIMHMQNMQFLAKSPLDNPDAVVYFVKPEQLKAPPYSCYTLYLTDNIDKQALQVFLKKLPQDCLVVDYDVGFELRHLGLQPKALLEEHILTEWQHMVAFLQRQGINPDNLVVGNALQFGAMDNALDTLLGIGSEFLRQAANLQRSINLAQPLANTPAEQQKLFEAVTRLAHRVQSLSPGTFNHYLLNTFGDSEATTYFLRDSASEIYVDLERAATISSH
jgi:hypothetical protein